MLALVQGLPGLTTPRRTYRVAHKGSGARAADCDVDFLRVQIRDECSRGRPRVRSRGVTANRPRETHVIPKRRLQELNGDIAATLRNDLVDTRLS